MYNAPKTRGILCPWSILYIWTGILNEANIVSILLFRLYVSPVLPILKVCIWYLSSSFTKLGQVTRIVKHDLLTIHYLDRSCSLIGGWADEKYDGKDTTHLEIPNLPLLLHACGCTWSILTWIMLTPITLPLLKTDRNHFKIYSIWPERVNSKIQH